MVVNNWPEKDRSKLFSKFLVLFWMDVTGGIHNCQNLELCILIISQFKMVV